MYGPTAVLASRDPLVRKAVRVILAACGRTVVGEAEDGVSAIQMIRTRLPDLVVLDEDIKNSSGLEVASIVGHDRIAPVVFLASYSRGRFPAGLKDLWVFAVVPKPVEEASFFMAVELAELNFTRVMAMEKEITRLKEELQNRKAVERAKGILMETMGLSEKEAFKRIQKQSMDRRTSMREVAEAIILAQDLQNNGCRKNNC